MQSRVFLAGRDEDGKVGVSVLPQGEEILVGLFGSGCVARKNGGARQADVRKRVNGRCGCVPCCTLVVDDLLEFSGGLFTLVKRNIGEAAQINPPRVPALVGSSRL